uniref:Seipin n=1 Tax=Caenorhabditis japonica TaxID=281687 RepID=A0A8R1DZ39_CAEJA
MGSAKERVVSIFFELCLTLIIAFLTPLVTRYALLPSSVHQQYPLNVVFRTCEHDLHSVCSFPAATLDYEQNSLFSPDILYYLNVRLKFADVANSKFLGLFQSVLRVEDENSKVLKQYTRSAYVKEPGMMTKAYHLFFYPLYLFGFFDDHQNSLVIPMTADYRETAEVPSTKLTFTIQDKFANVEDAELIVTARFGLIRHILYYWPTVSYVAIFLAVLALGIFLTGFKLAWQGYRTRSAAALEKDRREILRNQEEEDEGATKCDKNSNLKTEIVKNEETELRKRK